MTQAEAPPAEEVAAAAEAEAQPTEIDRLMAQPLASRAPTVQELARALPALCEMADLYFVARVCGQDTCEQVRAKVVAGAEKGWPPMYSIQNFTVSKDGRLGASALSMRADFLSIPGSELTITAGATQCTITGFRPGWSEWKTCQWTEQDSETAGLTAVGHKRDGGTFATTHGKYPEDMKVARCTTRWMRRYAADILGPLAYTAEELDENPEVAPPAPAPTADENAPQATPRRDRPSAPPEPAANPYTAMVASWKALAEARWPLIGKAAMKENFLAWATSLCKTDDDLSKTPSWSPERIALCQADLDAHHDPMPEDEREATL